jgi:branched-chain amino acid transport system substrate-binding protein
MIASRISRRTAIGGLLAGTALTVGSRRAWSQAGPIKIGALQTVSGPLATVGNASVLGAKIAVKQVNDNGGVNGRQIELEVRDTRGSGDGTVEGMRDLAGAGVNLTLGECFSTGTLAAVPLAPSLGMVYVAGTTIAMEITHDLYNRNCFRAGQSAFMQFLGQAHALCEQAPDAKRWGCFLADNAGFRFAQQYLYYGLKKSYAAKGKQIELLQPVVAKVGAPDYRNQASDLVAQKLDGLVVCDTGAEAITFLKQSLPFGVFKSLAAVGDMTYNPALGPAMKKDLPSNYFSTCTWYYPAFRQYPMVDDYYKQAVQATKVEAPDPLIAQAHLATTTIIEGVRHAKSTTTDDVIKAIEVMKYETIYGPMQFRAEDHQLHFNPGYIRLGPSDTAAGWKIEEFISVKWQDSIDPPSPGKKFELPTA